VAALDTGFIFQVDGGTSFRGDASGHVWKQIADPRRNVTRYFYDRSDRRLYAVTQRGALIASDDQGETWKSLGVPSQDLTFVHARGNTIVTGYNGTFGAAFVSRDGGATWTSPDSLKSAGTPAGGFVGTDGSLYFVFTLGLFPAYSSLWRSTDGGASWTELTKGMTTIPGTPLLMQSQAYAEGSTIFFTAGRSIWNSTDDGATWKMQNDGMTGSSTGSYTEMAFEGDDIYLLLQPFTSPGQGFGVYHRPASDLGLTGRAAGIEEEARIAGAALLAAPNPSRGSTTITLRLDAPATARVAVYDILGNEVTLLHAGRLDAGESRMSWDGEAPGAYVVRADIGGRIISTIVTRVR
jgi:hypothetical protein